MRRFRTAKWSRYLSVSTIVCISALLLPGCGGGGGSLKPEVASIEPTSARPMQMVTIRGKNLAPVDDLFIDFGRIAMPVLEGGGDHVKTILPLLPEGSVTVTAHRARPAGRGPGIDTRERLNGVSLTVLPPLTTGANAQQIAEKLTEPLTAIVEWMEQVLPNVVGDSVDKSQLTAAISEDMQTVQSIVDLIPEALSQLTSEQVQQLDAMLASSQAYDVLEQTRAAVTGLPRRTRQGPGPVDTEVQILKMAVDQLSAAISWFSAVVGLVELAALALDIANSLIGAVGPDVSIPPAVVMLLLKICKNYLDAFPVDIEGVSIDGMTNGQAIPVSIGQNTELRVIGEFTSESDFAVATVKSLVELVFWGPSQVLGEPPQKEPMARIIIDVHKVIFKVENKVVNSGMSKVVTTHPWKHSQPIDIGLYSSPMLSTIPLHLQTLMDRFGKFPGIGWTPLTGDPAQMQATTIATVEKYAPLTLRGQTTGDTKLDLRAWSWRPHNWGDNILETLGKILFPISYPQQTVEKSWPVRVSSPTGDVPVAIN